MSKLSKYFIGVAVKRLSAVEVDKKISNQHEFNGIKSMSRLFGEATGKLKIETDFIYLGEEEDDTLTTSGFLTWYDSRENHPTRTEYRMYYPANNEVINFAEQEDLLVIAKKQDGKALLFVIRNGSTFERQILWLFGITNETESFQVNTLEGSIDKEIGFVEAKILETLGIETAADDDWLDEILSRFKGSFPNTFIFSSFARETASEIDVLGNPDKALVFWLNHEEHLFRTLERYLVQKELDKGFDDVDAFINLSLSVQNRRKSRMGHALENHLEYIFTEHSLSFSKGKITEQNSKPDFLFPSINQYHDLTFPVEYLTMLGVKSTCKERWNQVLAEANRIEKKHLLTLEPGISINQTQKMQEKFLQLVLPQPLHETYLPEQQHWLMNLADFISLIKMREASI